MKHIQLFEQFINEAKEINHLTLYPSTNAFTDNREKNKITITFAELDAAANELGRAAKNLYVVKLHVLKSKKIDTSELFTPYENDEGIKDQSKKMAKRLDIRVS